MIVALSGVKLIFFEEKKTLVEFKNWYNKEIT